LVAGAADEDEADWACGSWSPFEAVFAFEPDPVPEPDVCPERSPSAWISAEKASASEEPLMGRPFETGAAMPALAALVA